MQVLDNHLFSALISGDVAAVSDLLKQGANPNAKALGLTFLHYAVEKKDWEIIRLLLMYGADPNGSDHYETFPLHDAVIKGDLRMVLLLLLAGANPNVKDSHGITPLHYAVWKGNRKVVRTLLNYGADPKIASKPNHLTPLHYAVAYKHAKIAQDLLKYGANPNERDKYGMTPLHYAAKTRNVATVQALLKRGADPNVQDKYQMTPLHYALLQKDRTEKEEQKSACFKVVRLLLKYGADANKCNGFALPPLYYAIEGNYVDVVKVLLEHGADSSVYTAIGCSPLHHAVMKKDEEIVRYLLEYGANPNVKDKNKITPLFYAVSEQQEKITFLLLKHGANPNCLGYPNDFIKYRYQLVKSMKFYDKEDDDNYRQLFILKLDLDSEEDDSYKRYKQLLSPFLRLTYKRDEKQEALLSKKRHYYKRIVNSRLERSKIEEQVLNKQLDGVVLSSKEKEYVEEVLDCFSMLGRLLKTLQDEQHFLKEEEIPMVGTFTLIKEMVERLKRRVIANLKPFGFDSWKAFVEAEPWFNMLLDKLDWSEKLSPKRTRKSKTKKKNRTKQSLEEKKRLLKMVIQEFVESSEDREKNTIKRISPLSLAIEKAILCWKEKNEQHVDWLMLVGLLLKHGAKLSEHDKKEYLHKAVVFGYTTLVALLLKYGADANDKVGYQQTFLHVAVYRGHVEVAQLLLQHQADPNQKNKDGWTPLHVAAHLHFVKLVELLLSFGADPKVKNNEGKKPIDLTSSLEVKKLLQEAMEK